MIGPRVPAASMNDFSSFVETLDILSDSLAVEELCLGLAETASGDTFSAEEVRAAMVFAGRLPRTAMS